MGNIFLCIKSKKRLCVIIVFASVIILTAYFSTPALAAQDQEHEPLEYEVAVRALLVPFVAVDASGKPVYDLRDDELELYINEKPTKIIYLHRMVFGDKEISAVEETQPVEDVKGMLTKTETRLVFIIVDALFNSVPGLKRSKAIARKLIENCTPQDRIVLLEIRMGGLKYIAGPEPGGKPFLKYLDKLKKNPHRILMWTESKYDRRDKKDFNEVRDGRGKALMEARRETVKMWLNAFHQYKNALRTIDEPKVTFLLTEDFLGELSNETHMFLEHRRIMEYMQKQIHDGGSVLQKVHVGGLRERHVIPMVNRLNKFTAAYYEVFFNPGLEAGENMNIAIKCKRPGVKINAVGHKEKDKPYQKMSKIQKKLFAVSTACGQGWSRLIGRVHQVSYQKMKTRKIGNETQTVLSVRIPDEIRGKKVDVFSLRFDDKYQDVDVSMEERAADEWETITLESKNEKKNLYFVIVERDTAYCFFNKVW